MTFTMWSFGHILFILSPIFFTVIIHLYSKNKTQDEKRKIGIILSLIAILLLILRNIEIWVKKDYTFDHELVPLQVCHFANFVLLYAFWKKSDVAFSLAFTLNLLAAMASIVFADSLENYSNILTFRGIAYIFGHILIVQITLWAFLNDFIFIKFKTYLKTVLTVEVMIILSVFINNFLYFIYGKYSNYFYTEHPEKGTPLETAFNFHKNLYIGDFKFNIVYIITLMISFAIVTFILYQIAKLFKRAE